MRNRSPYPNVKFDSENEICYSTARLANVAQPIEQLIRNQQVAGLSPAISLAVNLK